MLVSQGRSAVSGGMDPLGARSQFVDIQTLPTWPQQLEEGGEAASLEQGDGQDVPSPFPFRPDVNSKIILLWVPQLAPRPTAAAGWRWCMFRVFILLNPECFGGCFVQEILISLPVHIQFMGEILDLWI